MLECTSVENMRRSDALTIERFVPSLELMGRAAEGVFRAASWLGRVAIVAGSGNNGGDGFALACILQSQGLDCVVFALSDRLSADSAFYAERARSLGVMVHPFTSASLQGFDIVVDCLLGTGFRGALRENYRAAIEAVNASGAYVISVDINSGMNGDAGEAELAVRSDLTVTIGYVKNGLLTENAGAHMKKLMCADIGIVLAAEENKILDTGEWKAFCAAHSIPPRQTWAEHAGQMFFLCPPWLDMTVIRAF